MTIPDFAKSLCDDAAVFPPGLAPLPDAVAAHTRHTDAPYAELVGPLVLAAPALAELAGLLESGDRLDLSVTAPEGPGQLRAVFDAAGSLPVRLRALEVAVPAGQAPTEFFTELDRACAAAEDVAIFVEVPRDQRRPEIIAACAGTRYQAKFRTGGVKAELYPDEAELAAAIRAVVDARVPFKATAGLHHAIRNTDPATGFEQHGYLNLLLATDAAVDFADESEIAEILAERDARKVAERVANLDDARGAAARERFLSFGTCSIIEPLTELVDLGLVPAAVLSAEGVAS
ncbi:hypothetical protein [Saccharopolyspora elongata]|uniref:Uncharacterized protein n=1 Tax=Saccharopolyspora elongata TaxID=2530387 RepID=A0A4R4Y5K4_9PSEU|nr:hypothetical protein [Saccharopolyspora elongata]TDD38242.1 hypothetical protein E1288_39145 [Saccharopolyspora elongata]